MTDWTEDENLKLALDTWAMNSASALKQLLDATFEYREQIDPMMQALLFGVLGKFTLTYAGFRSEANTFHDSFNNAIAAVQTDPRVQRVMQMAAENAADRAVERLE
jgi:hypothetical protein